MPFQPLLYSLSDGSNGTIEADVVMTIPANQTIAFDLASGGNWYGHGFHHVQEYPWESGSLVNEKFAVNNIQSPIWMASNGVALWADTTRVLDVRINENGSGVLAIRCSDEPLRLVCKVGVHLPAAQSKLMTELGWPNRPPEARLFGDSLFCTWTQYPRCIDQENILEMGRQIRERGYPCSTLIIDDRWESSFGELEFGPDFPDPAAMIEELHELGFQVWLWVTPFVNNDSNGFDELSEAKVLVPGVDGEGAALFRWWGGTAGLIDVTGPQGRTWFQEKLRYLQEHYGIDGFKIDGGDFKYQPSPESADWYEFAGESGYSDALLGTVEELVPNVSESRAAWLSQGRSIIWRQGGKDSHWGKDNGLRALVRLALHLSVMGYDLLIPDMVPGRVQTMNADDPLPTDELMVRWTEVSAFMPFIQFSYFPWNYNEATERVVRSFALVHKKLEGYLAKQAEDRRAPLIRPLWYDAPCEEDAYTVDDEFLLGHDLLIAPVLDAGVTRRDVYLPDGEWIDAWSGSPVGRGWTRGYHAPCPGIPLFVRAQARELLAVLRAALAVIPCDTVPSGPTSTFYSSGLDRDLSVTG